MDVREGLRAVSGTQKLVTINGGYCHYHCYYFYLWPRVTECHGNMNPTGARTSICGFRVLGGPLGAMPRGLFKGRVLSSVTMEKPIQWDRF